MDTKHTPGPWIVKTAINGDRGIVAPGIGILAECFVAIRNMDEVSPECEANARLIAAAPGLLEALEEMIELASPNIYPQPDKSQSGWAKLQRARAAIAKAKGGDA